MVRAPRFIRTRRDIRDRCVRSGCELRLAVSARVGRCANNRSNPRASGTLDIISLSSTNRRVRRILDTPRPGGGPGTTYVGGRARPSRRPASEAPVLVRASARAARGGAAASTSAAPAIRRILRGFPASQPAPRQSPPTDTAPAASHTLLPPPHSPPSVPDLAPSHHTHFHLRFLSRFRPKKVSALLSLGALEYS